MKKYSLLWSLLMSGLCSAQFASKSHHFDVSTGFAAVKDRVGFLFGTGYSYGFSGNLVTAKYNYVYNKRFQGFLANESRVIISDAALLYGRTFPLNENMLLSTSAGIAYDKVFFTEYDYDEETGAETAMKYQQSHIGVPLDVTLRFFRAKQTNVSYVALRAQGTISKNSFASFGVAFGLTSPRTD